MQSCPHCHVALIESAVPHEIGKILEIWFCPRCRYQEPGAIRDGQLEIEPEFTVHITWNPATPLPQVLKTLREVDPELRKLPAVEAMAKLRILQRWEIDGLMHSQMCEVKQACEVAKLDCETK